jgi:hypothetical protein
MVDGIGEEQAGRVKVRILWMACARGMPPCDRSVMVPIDLTIRSREERKIEGSNSNFPPFVRGISDFGYPTPCLTGRALECGL